MDKGFPYFWKRFNSTYHDTCTEWRSVNKRKPNAVSHAIDYNPLQCITTLLWEMHSHNIEGKVERGMSSRITTCIITFTYNKHRCLG
jgi:hypothetical protein